MIKFQSLNFHLFFWKTSSGFQQLKHIQQPSQRINIKYQRI